MAELSLTQVFGAGATQTSTTITISKADLTGLTPNASNRADSLAVGIIARLVEVYTPAARAADEDISIVALPQVPQIATTREVVNGLLVETSFLNKPVLVNLYNPFAVSPASPDDY